jgi:hypothetical protein
MDSQIFILKLEKEIWCGNAFRENETLREKSFLGSADSTSKCTTLPKDFCRRSEI